MLIFGSGIFFKKNDITNFDIHCLDLAVISDFGHYLRRQFLLSEAFLLQYQGYKFSPCTLFRLFRVFDEDSVFKRF